MQEARSNVLARTQEARSNVLAHTQRTRAHTTHARTQRSHTSAPTPSSTQHTCCNFLTCRLKCGSSASGKLEYDCLPPEPLQYNYKNTSEKKSPRVQQVWFDSTGLDGWNGTTRAIVRDIPLSDMEVSGGLDLVLKGTPHLL